MKIARTHTLVQVLLVVMIPILAYLFIRIADIYLSKPEIGYLLSASMVFALASYFRVPSEWKYGKRTFYITALQFAILATLAAVMDWSPMQDTVSVPLFAVVVAITLVSIASVWMNQD